MDGRASADLVTRCCPEACVQISTASRLRFAGTVRAPSRVSPRGQGARGRMRVVRGCPEGFPRGPRTAPVGMADGAMQIPRTFGGRVAPAALPCGPDGRQRLRQSAGKSRILFDDENRLPCSLAWGQPSRAPRPSSIPSSRPSAPFPSVRPPHPSPTSSHPRLRRGVCARMEIERSSVHLLTPVAITPSPRNGEHASPEMDEGRKRFAALPPLRLQPSGLRTQHLGLST